MQPRKLQISQCPSQRISAIDCSYWHANKLISCLYARVHPPRNRRHVVFTQYRQKRSSVRQSMHLQYGPHHASSETLPWGSNCLQKALSLYKVFTVLSNASRAFGYRDKHYCLRKRTLLRYCFDPRVDRHVQAHLSIYCFFFFCTRKRMTIGNEPVWSKTKMTSFHEERN